MMVYVRHETSPRRLWKNSTQSHQRTISVRIEGRGDAKALPVKKPRRATRRNLVKSGTSRFRTNYVERSQKKPAHPNAGTRNARRDVG